MSKEEIRSRFLKFAPTKLGESIIERLIELDYLIQDKEYVIKKLGLSDEDFNNILNSENKTFADYPNNDSLLKDKEFYHLRHYW